MSNIVKNLPHIGYHRILSANIILFYKIILDSRVQLVSQKGRHPKNLRNFIIVMVILLLGICYLLYNSKTCKIIASSRSCSATRSCFFMISLLNRISVINMEILPWHLKINWYFDFHRLVPTQRLSSTITSSWPSIQEHNCCT